MSTINQTEQTTITTTEQPTKQRSFGRTKSEHTTFKPKKQDNRGVKDFKDYVYVGQEDVDKTTLAPILKEDTDYNKKIKDKIEVDKEYTYSQLCELLGEKSNGGNAKQIQLATWFQHFEWEHPINPKTKNPSKKFLITTIYDTPRPKINQTYQLENFTKQELECNFIFSILDNENLHEEVSDFGLITGVKARDMHLNIGLVNNDYYSVRSNKEAIADYLPIPNQIKVFSTVENYNKKFTTGALSRLTRAKVIEGYMYTYIWTDTQRKEHLATDQEHLAIENGIKEMVTYAQEEVGIEVNSIADLYNGKLQDFQAEDLHNHMMGLIKKEIPNIEYFSRAYKLVYLRSKMRDYLFKLADEMGITIEELQQTKLYDSRQEHTEFQVGKAMKRNNKQPETQEKEVSLINAIINNTNLNPMTDKERKLEHDRKFILDRVTVSEYITQLSLDDINKILSDTVEKHEQEYLDTLIEDAISYCCMPITLSATNKEIEFADLNKFIDKFGNIKSFYLECKYATDDKLNATLHINHTKGHGRADKLEIALHNMTDIRNLQAYLIVSYNVEVKVGQKFKQNKNTK